MTTLLNRQAVQHPGELVLMQSNQLSGLQDLVGALRSLGFVLPLLALLLYVSRPLPGEGLASGSDDFRRGRDPGGGAAPPADEAPDRRRCGNSVVSSDSVKPAVTAIWDIISGGLRQRALFVLVIGAGVHRGRRSGGTRSPRHGRAALPRTVPPRSARRRLLRRRRAVPPLAHDHARDQQPRTGHRHHRSRTARRIRCGVAPSADGAGVPGSSPKFLSRRPIALIPAPFAGRDRVGS